MWLAQNTLPGDVQQSFNDCQLLLYIICERYPSARRYRDVFERVKSAASTIRRPHTDSSSHSGIDYAPTQLSNDANLGWSADLSSDLQQMIDEMSGPAIDPFLGLAALPDLNQDYPLTGLWWN